MVDPPTPTREAGLARLAAFLPRAGTHYARLRNHDEGPGERQHVSGLSPWLRLRRVTEAEVVAAALHRHGEAAAQRFVDEVLWRTYWKGWLELRPGVWTAFGAEVERARDGLGAAAARRLADAEAGRTGIEGFDDWARELVQTGYLHNHARMWFASIWSHTLGLPWALGADFFLRHLLDADPASNTLSWRWVVGLQTPGKQYLARADNIHRCTGGRFRPQGLATEAPPPPPAAPPPQPRPLPPAHAGRLPKNTLWLLHPEDLDPDSLLTPGAVADLVGAVAVDALQGPPAWPWGSHATAATRGAVDDTLSRSPLLQPLDARRLATGDPAEVLAAAHASGAGTVATAWAPVGPVADWLDEVERALSAQGIGLLRLRRDWDSRLWPLATHGFFRFRQRATPLLSGLLPAPPQA